MDNELFQKLLNRCIIQMSLRPIENDFYRGYARGLRRQFYGEKFGTLEEHNRWFNCASIDVGRQAMQDGYRAGYSGEDINLTGGEYGNRGK